MSPVRGPEGPAWLILASAGRWKGRGADSEEKHEPVCDTNSARMDSLKVLDPKRPIREEKRT
jgi:hypothetical protein